MPPTATGILDHVRQSCTRVLAAGGPVRLVPSAVDPEARLLLEEPPDRSTGGTGPETATAGSAADAEDPWAVAGGDDEARAATVLALSAVNFGSGWHPVVRKLPGCSGAVTMATHLRRHLATGGPPTADRLAAWTPATAHRVFDQPEGGPADDLMAAFADALGQLGRLVADEHGGSFTALVAAADGSADRLVGALGTLPTFHDVAVLDGQEVAFYKRAQLAVADLARAFGGRGLGAFADLDRLTAFADNLVPHVLRLDGVLTFDPTLLATIEAGALLPAGGPDEVAIRAGAVVGVEALAAATTRLGRPVPPHELDRRLWLRGGRPAAKAHPRPRARSPFY
ncbi:MAG: queuosine salvage family protein [Acidimicrobiales bacterium]